MGLAVLPSRLKSEMEEIASQVLAGNTDFRENDKIAKHQLGFNGFRDKYDFYAMDEPEIIDVLKNEIGNTFINVLRDAGVYKCTPKGRDAFKKFIDYVNLSLK